MTGKIRNQRMKDFVEGLELLDGEKLVNYVTAEKDWLINESGYSESSLGTLISQYLSKISNSTLPDDKKEISRKLLNLSKEQWNKRKAPQHKKTEEQARNTVSLNPHLLIESAKNGLESDKTAELGAALLFLSGRRPSELIKTARFKKIDDVHLEFSGQIKNRGIVRKAYEIPCLVQTDLFLEAFERFRNMSRILELIEIEDFAEIDSKFNNSLRYQIRKVFSDLPPSHGQKQISSNNLRSAYATVATKFYCPKNVTDLLYYGDILGHSRPKEIEHDEQVRQSYATTLSYFDYRVELDEEKSLVENISKSVRNIKSRKTINAEMITTQLIELWKLSDDEKEMINNIAVEKELSVLDFIKNAVLGEAKRRSSLNQKSVVAANLDSQSLKASEGKGAPRYKGITDVKLKRALEAIMAWNNEQSDLEKKWAVTVNGLKRLTGTKHETISNFIKQNLEVILNHHQKHQIDEKRQNTARGKKGDKIEDDVIW